ncbi:ATP-binding cassette domain-containing protein [Pelomonas sp. CA6]|uniref:ABC transporter ATP-binding protein n=1 Tax=Pelomonas sp. CA6 TaxID=2907999 RepID=UPI001F4BDC1C|nr:oligopeptide/dipeptide ABC transporter ATP-binding protein [Pelomonas sp. CA6]MCH7344248.1 ATP-binding cassette domain-containing protein [Pelomonas sp. CA6]
MNTPLIEVRHLHRRFGSSERPVRAVDDVSFSIQPGETLGLVGESGSGKSTIGRSLLRLIEPSEGEVVYRGEPLGRASAARMRQLRSRLQMIFQDPYASLNPRMRIAEILAEPLRTHGLARGPGERARRIAELLTLVGLRPEHAQRHPHEFSGGQRQRIGIARALAAEPEFIVADEPLSALDVSIQAQVVNLLCELRERFQLTLLFISHDLDVVEYLCDRVVVLYLGRVMEVAPTRELFARPLHPYTRALLAASPRPDPEQPPLRQVLKGDIPSPLDPPSGCVFRTGCPQAIAACAAERPPLLTMASGRQVACIRTELMGEGGDGDTA